MLWTLVWFLSAWKTNFFPSYHRDKDATVNAEEMSICLLRNLGMSFAASLFRIFVVDHQVLDTRANIFPVCS